MGLVEIKLFHHGLHGSWFLKNHGRLGEIANCLQPVHGHVAKIGVMGLYNLCFMVCNCHVRPCIRREAPNQHTTSSSSFNYLFFGFCHTMFIFSHLQLSIYGKSWAFSIPALLFMFKHRASFSFLIAWENCEVLFHWGKKDAQLAHSEVTVALACRRNSIWRPRCSFAFLRETLCKWYSDVWFDK